MWYARVLSTGDFIEQGTWKSSGLVGSGDIYL